MSDVTMKQLLEAGVHFGHQTRRWNPKMEPYIFGERNGIHIINLRQTLEEIQRAHAFVRDLVMNGGQVLFVGTKKQAQPAILEAATISDMPYVNFRWLGGMLTNFKTINKRIFYMKELARMEESGDMEHLPKKERLRLRREYIKLERTLGGVSDMERTPSAVFIVDLNTEHIVVKEAARLKIPVIALVDSNCDPTDVEFVIPGNDDAIRSASLVANAIAAACVDGRELARAKSKDEAEGSDDPSEDATDQAGADDAQPGKADATEAAPAKKAD
jgi:small subunit ribosomal protein S2